MRSGSNEAAPLHRSDLAPTLTVLKPLSFTWVRIVGGEVFGGGGETPFSFSHCQVLDSFASNVMVEARGPGEGLFWKMGATATARWVERE